MKLMMPNLFKYPVILDSMFINSDSFSDSKSKAIQSKWYPHPWVRYRRLVGPLASTDAGLNAALAAIVWFVVPIAAKHCKQKFI